MTTQANFRVQVFPDDAMLHMVLAGFWSDETVNAFAAELDRAMSILAKAGVTSGDYVYLADFRQSMVQSQTMVDQFKLIAARVGTRARRVAVLTGSTLQKMQAERMSLGQAHYRFFQGYEEEAARRWLLGRDPE